MESTLKQFLRGKTAVSTQSPTWQWHNYPRRLHQQTFLSSDLPPDELTSSARAILLRGNEVMVIRDFQNDPYIIPGGRREPGETVMDTLRRELLGETGWSVGTTAVIGTIYFEHLTPKPPDYKYPHPHFFWPIFVAQADQFYPKAIQPEKHAVSSEVRLISEVIAWDLGDGQIELLKAALNARQGAT
ncbi:MAG: NUDIX hydrolase [Ardenticatenaceae bacterium]|nr:NUDIX hydrolase [Anaerolineales bacterium]MCB8940854.1 NUDIX hydrolase [Ardenticatenaceae bacterium]MCB8972193.1 NUDIX hydrolase [Ardenticatenaceae bacterium]